MSLFKASFYNLSRKEGDFQEFFSQQLLYIIKQNFQCLVIQSQHLQKKMLLIIIV